MTMTMDAPLNEAATGPRRTLPLPGRIQFSYNTRFTSAKVAANPQAYHLVAGEDVVPTPGDIVIAKVTEIRNHRRVETEVSRKAILYREALVALAYGNRYAADQFLAHVPDSLENCHLVAAGGIAGTVTEVHSKLAGPTSIEPLGLLATDDGVVNLIQDAPLKNLPVGEVAFERPEVRAILGTSMNSGKSTVMSCTVNGLTKSGLKVGAGKITGTGAGNDRMHYFDAGAHEVVDFTDFGYGTTFKLDFEAIRALTLNMIEVLGRNNDIVLVEIADGVYQEETARLLRDELFHSSVDTVAFAAVDALGARAGVHELLDAGLNVSCASGVLTSSPLATAEAAAVLRPVGVPVIGTFELTQPEVATGIGVRVG
ncbi:malic enzyme protein [Corynebacterium uterequi]|uniref:Molybdopterin-guanine dinucleotide biosynthesis protein n=1 Tax=Corynebacterium uterequi TaxID=1072256 RepID=A0A0G3HG47_9CORY|nr:malic enzyme protein [Corynebacterium uterequi]AKK10928.1 molybdopterin-guanine dinucleotide biosynthesis protein [Corynebacterium uterequi]